MASSKGSLILSLERVDNYSGLHTHRQQRVAQETQSGGYIIVLLVVCLCYKGVGLLRYIYISTGEARTAWVNQFLPSAYGASPHSQCAGLYIVYTNIYDWDENLGDPNARDTHTHTHTTRTNNALTKLFCRSTTITLYSRLLWRRRRFGFNSLFCADAGAKEHSM